MERLQLPFRDDWFLAVNLRAQGFDVALDVKRTDGAPLSDADVRTIRAAVVALATADAQVYEQFRRANAAASKKPRRKATSAPAKPAAKRKAAKAAPKRKTPARASRGSR